VQNTTFSFDFGNCLAQINWIYVQFSHQHFQCLFILFDADQKSQIELRKFEPFCFRLQYFRNEWKTFSLPPQDFEITCALNRNKLFKVCAQSSEAGSWE